MEERILQELGTAGLAESFHRSFLAGSSMFAWRRWEEDPFPSADEISTMLI
ncbi:MAG: hypothetical protein ACLUOI_18230 [Eisenbergiella sp.]